MRRIQFLMPDSRVRDLDLLASRIGISTRTDLINSALTLFEWAVREREAGCIIASIDEKSQRYKEIELPDLPPVETGKPRRRIPLLAGARE